MVCRELKYPINEFILQHLDLLVGDKKMKNILEVLPSKFLLETQFRQYIADTTQRLLQREIQTLNKRT